MANSLAVQHNYNFGPLKIQHWQIESMIVVDSNWSNSIKITKWDDKGPIGIHLLVIKLSRYKNSYERKYIDYSWFQVADYKTLW